MFEALAALVVGFILGYVARKYVEKKYPSEAARLDEKAKYYGQDLRERADEVYTDARDNLRK